MNCPSILPLPQRYLKKRWLSEYLFALRDQRNPEKTQSIPQIGDVVLTTEGLDGLKPEWNLGRVLDHIKGKDGVIRGLRLKNKTGYEIERPIQLVRNLEISEQGISKEQCPNLNESVTQSAKRSEDIDLTKSANVTKRPQRKAAQAARDFLIGQELNEKEEVY